MKIEWLYCLDRFISFTIYSNSKLETRDTNLTRWYLPQSYSEPHLNLSKLSTCRRVPNRHTSFLLCSFGSLKSPYYAWSSLESRWNSYWTHLTAASARNVCYLINQQLHSFFLFLIKWCLVERHVGDNQPRKPLNHLDRDHHLIKLYGHSL